MLRLTHRPLAYLSATLLVVASCQLCAFEQGTYFIFQLVDPTEKQQTVAPRLALDSQLFSASQKTETTSAPSKTKRSEFEMDYTSLGPAKASGFSTSFSTTETTTSETSSFNLSTEKPISLFGD